MKVLDRLIKRSAAISLSCIALSSMVYSFSATAATSAGVRGNEICWEPNGSGYYPPSNTASLPTEVPRPGPDVLYWPLASSPQLENTCVWTADPILISGVSAYRKREFLYQDFLYDDTALTYPTGSDATLGRNAADIVEIRVKQMPDGLAIRITYNTMLNPELAAATIALGTSAAARAMPHNAGASMPAEVFVTVHGNSGDIVNAAKGTTLSIRPTVLTDLVRRQVHVRVPYSAFDPRTAATLRVGAAVGLWDTVANRYLRPNPALPAFFNVGFRYNEPRALAWPGNWRAASQNAALANGGDLSAFFANIDLSKLASGNDDDMVGLPGGVPASGLMTRILVSQFESAQGRGTAPSLRPDQCSQQPCIPTYAGRLQPYDIYVSQKQAPAGGYGLGWVLHGAGGNHNSEVQISHLAEKAPGFILFTPEARGPVYWYYGQAGANAFEVWADIAARYPLNPHRTAIYGTSMGGYGTLKTASQYPDLFARVHPIIPCHWANVGTALPNELSRMLPMAASFRNTPVYAIYGELDLACEDPEFERIVAEWDRLGYRYETHKYPGGHGGGFIAATQPPVLSISSKWLAQAVVDRNPPRVTFSTNAEMSQPEVGLSNDRAFWVSGLKVRNVQSIPPVGTIDVFSYGFGRADPPALPTQQGTSVTPGQSPAEPFAFQRKEWGAAATAPIQNKLNITTANISELTIHVDRARVSCDATLNVQSDGPVLVTLTGSACSRRAQF